MAPSATEFAGYPELNNTRSDLTTAKVKLQKFEEVTDVVGSLYEAVERAITRLSAIKTDEETALVENLKTSMAAAKKFIDPIPF